MVETPILIAGAGPTGLVLALSLTRQGIPVRIIEKNRGPGEASRAIAVHARTLEFYNQLGIVDEIVGKGIKVERIHFRGVGNKEVFIPVKGMGNGLSAYPYVLSLPQDEHEKILVAELKKAGVEVEWQTELKSFAQDDHEVKAVLSKGGAEETVTASYMAGCDGAHSRVREGLNIGFPGGTYNDLFYVADVKLDKDTAGTDFQANLASQDFTLVLPVRTTGMHRLIGVIPKEVSAVKEKPSFEDIYPAIEPMIGAKVTDLNWFSTYRVHHRVADKFRVGRSFLLGDAGHVHSPAGGQGMNTGIGDSINLSWKLAQVIRQRAPDALLDTYEPERISFARKLVATTDTAFSALVKPGLAGKFVRAVIAPRLLPIAAGFAAIRRMIFKTISQIKINYPNSAISAGKAGGVKAGDRLPWVEALNNFRPLQGMKWQMHVYGDAKAVFVKNAEDMGIPVHVFKADEAVQKAGIKPNSAFLIRPDGYISFATCDQDVKPLQKFIERNQLKFKS